MLRKKKEVTPGTELDNIKAKTDQMLKIPRMFEKCSKLILSVDSPLASAAHISPAAFNTIPYNMNTDWAEPVDAAFLYTEGEHFTHERVFKFWQPVLNAEYVCSPFPTARLAPARLHPHSCRFFFALHPGSLPLLFPGASRQGTHAVVPQRECVCFGARARRTLLLALHAAASPFATVHHAHYVPRTHTRGQPSIRVRLNVLADAGTTAGSA